MIVAVARRKDLLDTLVLEIEARGGRALAVQCDVTDLKQVRAARDAAVQHFGTIDRIIANAGGGERNPADQFSGQAIADMLTLNVTSAANCIEAVLPDMLQRGTGHIVLMSSLASRRGLPRATGYSGAKAAMTALGEGLRAELKPRGIDVTVLMPGFIAVKEGRKPRPFEVPLDVAAQRMAEAIVARRKCYMFPWQLVAITAILRALPAGISDWIVQRVQGPGQD
jgi:short-subunit dehydrogenase